MKITTDWQGRMKFEASDGTRASHMDASPPFGEGAHLSPKQLCLAAIGGCTAMDVVAFVRKQKEEMESLRIEADAPLTEGYPSVFRHVDLDFYAKGPVTAATLKEAVVLSQTKFCGVSAMIAKSCPVRYRVFLNGDEIAAGEAAF